MWLWLHRYMWNIKLIKLYTLSMWSLLYVYHTSIRLFIKNSKKLFKISHASPWRNNSTICECEKKVFHLMNFSFILPIRCIAIFLFSYLISLTFLLTFMLVIDVHLYSHLTSIYWGYSLCQSLFQIWGCISEQNTVKSWWSWCSEEDRHWHHFKTN